MARNPNNRLERWEVAIIKAMMAETPRKTDQDILACQTALKIDPLSASKIDPSVGCPGLAARRVAIS